ncbi:hydrolase [Ktedonobacter sp. SOSP1-85]|uniref:MBL fold metallo-hydrolase n=1 Tax=Ktedonobacter sp. SOSP1-85 TaxID=2778367 RepID=UPI001915FA94|nr:MBL fold metallo-hydrolase [Ktedonobacter sp. SOSP1-85]GHO72646.1 hydrolase [Ktedonobacter sp. SOSP1-85]
MEITKGIHLLDGTKGSYVYLILGEEPVLIDTSLPGRAHTILDSLEYLGLKPTDLAHIFLTHYDVDHIGNARALREASGAKLWAPREDLPYIRGEMNPPGVRRLIQMLYRVDAPQIDETYKPGQTIAGLEVIPTPGHTLGHVSFRIHDILFSGDLVRNKNGKLQPQPAMATWDRAALKRSLSEVGNYAFTWVCPAHGEPIQRGNLWETLVEC